jgi:putative ABC transport system ATP-binding protein
MSALELCCVSKRVGSGAHAISAVREVSLALASRDVVLLEGPSGAGKTTLLTLAAGLLTPDGGEVVLGGARLRALAPGAVRGLRARAVGFVFQRANLLSALTVRENVLIAAALAGLSRGEAEARADRLLDRLGLGAVGSRLPERLSGGEEQRVAVARSLVHGPLVVLADEPTGSLDGASGRAVAETLAELARESGAAVLVATHDQRLRDLASRRLHMSDGRVAPCPVA